MRIDLQNANWGYSFPVNCHAEHAFPERMGIGEPPTRQSKAWVGRICQRWGFSRMPENIWGNWNMQDEMRELYNAVPAIRYLEL